jgi:hypothetical protein
MDYPYRANPYGCAAPPGARAAAPAGFGPLVAEKYAGAAVSSQLPRSLANWMAVLGWISIGTGVLSCLTVVGLLWGWLPLVMGLFLTRGSLAFRQFSQRNDPSNLEAGLTYVRNYFVLQVVVIAVAALIALAMVALWLVIGAALGALWPHGVAS